MFPQKYKKTSKYLQDYKCCPRVLNKSPDTKSPHRHPLWQTSFVSENYYPLIYRKKGQEEQLYERKMKVLKGIHAILARCFLIISGKPISEDIVNRVALDEKNKPEEQLQMDAVIEIGKTKSDL